jgi:Fe-S-cluster containining protein
MSRNDPCPCGSGKKYKKCCGQLSGFTAAGPAAESRIRLNRAMAYKGVIGRHREQFCEQYVAHKQNAIGVIESSLRQEVAANNEVISCGRGCIECCHLFVIATLQECEGIVYWLYRHPDLLLSFLHNLEVWSREVSKIRSVFNTIVESTEETQRLPQRQGAPSRLISATRDYLLSKIPCPFLVSGACSIYEVRPWACASLVSVSPREWCDPSNPNTQPVKHYQPNDCYAAELHFYLQTKVDIPTGCLPIMVDRLLEEGYGALAEITGVSELLSSAMRDPEVLETLRRIKDAES